VHFVYVTFKASVLSSRKDKDNLTDTTYVHFAHSPHYFGMLKFVA